MTDALLTRLCELVSPPSSPLHSHGNWGDVQRSLAVTLPTDYKRMIDLFGQGVFRGHEHYSGLLITSFFRPAPAAKLAYAAGDYLRTLDNLTYPVYPDVPGLLGFGAYADEDTISWYTEGPPDEWSIVYHDVETGLHEIKQVGILQLTVSVLEETSVLHQMGVIKKGEMQGPHSFAPED